MGFELIFSYQEEIEKGKYDEEVKTKQIKVGSPYDEVPLELAASKIFAQLARRNILVTDVKVYELTKKQVSYKEVDDGFLIKNRKFKFDDGPSVVSSEEDTESPRDKLATILAENPLLLQQLSKITEPNKEQYIPSVNLVNVPQPDVKQFGRPIKEEIFDPPKELLIEAQKRGIAFTVGKKYKIYSEKVAPGGVIYVALDDNNQKRSINSIHFNCPIKLDGPFEDQIVPSGQEPNLDWGGAANSYNVPDIRG